MLVSICCITYNHEKYIAQAIQSFLTQETSFDFEIVVGEDHSTDNTAAIVSEFARKYPEKIRMLDNSQNLGLAHNFFRTLQACRGELIAYCEGDDYWIDNMKLQKQVDIFRLYPNVVYCYTNACILQDGEISHNAIIDVNKTKEEFDMNKYMSSYHAMPMLTSMFRSKYIQSDIPDFMYKVIQLDYTLRFFVGQHGTFYYLPEVTGVYRKHEGGITNNTIPFLESTIYINKQLNKYFNYKHSFFFGNYPYKTYERLAYAYSEKRKAFNTLKYLIKGMFKKRFLLRNLSENISIVKHVLKIYLKKKYNL